VRSFLGPPAPRPRLQLLPTHPSRGALSFPPKPHPTPNPPHPQTPQQQAILAKQRAETLSSVLYPDDRTYEGKELRLKQQHFFVSATMQARSARAHRPPAGSGSARGGTAPPSLPPSRAPCAALNH